LNNVFTCLVHEKPEVIWDLVCNLRYLDPASSILLYNNSKDASLLSDKRFQTEPYIFVYPESKQHRYGALHGYMLDCMEWACQNKEFDTITNVDSDQLLLQPGYTERLSQIMTQNPNLGMLQSSPATPQWPNETADNLGGRRFQAYPQRTALTEIGHWQPFLRKYDRSLDRFPLWSFWPGTTFSRQACRAILGLLENSLLLRSLINRSRIFATEEVILPILVDVLGFDLVQTPFDETCLRFKTHYSVDTLAESLSLPNRLWMHPVPRDLDDPLRAHLRKYYQHYGQE
jgi:hypothetical protein